jgi:DNA-binding TFAR19-related protein (PDSD5 family)
MKDFQLDEKVKKKKASLINTLTERAADTAEGADTAPAAEAAWVEEKTGTGRKIGRKRKITGFTLDPIVRDRLAAVAMVEDKNMSRIVEELVNKLFEQKWSEWDEDTKRFLLKRFPELRP